MASATEVVGRDRLPDVEPAPPEQWYDRSSLTVDATVTIQGQTEEDFYRYAPENRFCEFIDGVVYLPSPASLWHQDVLGFLFDLLNGFRLARGMGKVMMGPAVLRVAPDRDLEPDIFVVPLGAEPLPPTGLALGAADLVVEILSPGNRSHDLVCKADVYRQAGIPEVWFVDERDHVLLVERRGEGGYESHRVGSGPWASSALPGFWIDVDWLWADPLPNPRRCLETILAGPPA